MTMAESPPVPVRRRGDSVWGDGSPRPGLLGAAADAGGVLATAARLLWRHWPVLLTLFLTAIAVRELIFRAAVRVSLANAELGWLVVMLAPMTTLAALVLMLRVVRGSLPWLGGPGAGRPTSILAHLGSVLVPFLAVYSFEDDLIDDIREYSYRLWEDSTARLFQNAVDAILTGEQAEPGAVPTAVERLPYDLSLSLAVAVVLAIVARWALSRWSLAQRHRWLGILGAYLELLWITLVAVIALKSVVEWLTGWTGNRRVVQATGGVRDRLLGWLNGLVPEPVGDWFGGLFGHVEAVIVIPLVWLALAAVVLGHEPAPISGPPRVYETARRRWFSAPRAVRWLTEKVTADLRERFTPLLRGIRMLLRTGIVPMLMFCLAFVAVRAVSDWLWQLQRLAIGPQDQTAVWHPLTFPLAAVNDAVGQVLLVCLLAAAIDRVVHASAARSAPPAGSAEREPDVPAQLVNRGQP
jgi:hypothetical protein